MAAFIIAILAETRIILLTALRREMDLLRNAVPAAARTHVIGPCARHLHAVGKLPEPGWLVVLAGLAGGLEPKLKSAAVVVDDGGKIFTAPGIIASPAQKAELFARTGALAVDMEGDTVRAWADSMQAKFLHVRAIGDTADQTLDANMLRLVTPAGNTRWAAAAAYAISHPLRIGPMMQIGNSSNRALTTLAYALPTIIAAYTR